MKLKVYIETTIPSFFFEERNDIEALSRKNWTMQWWDSEAVNYDLFLVWLLLKN